MMDLNREKHLSQANDLHAEKDILSTYYESQNSHAHRKKLGQFYTHKSLVKYIFNNVPVKPDSSILDPSVGAGAFLISALEFNDNNHKKIYGVDVDCKALDLCLQNVEDTSGFVEKSNFKCADTINSNLAELFPEVHIAGGFDIVIGNPPYKLESNSNFDSRGENFKPYLNGVANSATLMIAKGLEFLRAGGYLGFVLPKTILRVDSFSSLRKYLAESFTIKNIFDLGHYFKDVRGDQIILILQKTAPKTSKNLISVSIKNKANSLDDSHDYTIPQKDLVKQNYYPIYRRKTLVSLADKLTKIPLKIEDVCDGNIFRGLNISSKHPSLSEADSTGLIKTFRGDSISKFGVKYSLYLNPSEAVLSKTKLARLKNDKIVLQNICSKEAGITATLSNAEEVSLDTVTNLVTDKVDLKILLGILNSNLSNFFLLHIIFLSSNFTMHTDRQYIGQLPMVLPTPEDAIKVIETVDLLLETNGIRNEHYGELYRLLNKQIYKIYDLEKTEIRNIETCLKETLSNKQFYGTENE
jgi:tRNA1(Val) A37 N6-methylase TrmN6